MAGLVEQLQADALDNIVPVSTLLGKVKVCAARLALEDALVWVENELNGYECHADDLPKYRRGHGILIGQDRFARWVPMHFANSDMADKISEVYFREPVSSYEDLLSSNGREFVLNLENELVNMVAQGYKIDVYAIRNKVSRGSINAIVQKVRNLVLDWSLELSRAGITGEGMSFSADERRRADSAHISIGTFNGSFNTGNASGEGAKINQSYALTNSDVPAIAQLIAAVQANLPSSVERDAIVAAAAEFAEAKDKPSMLKSYERLLSAAANHMTVITPFLPAIGQMLAG